MSRILSARFAAALVAGLPRVGLCEIGHPSGTFYGWTGIGQKAYAGTTYTGMGNLGRVSPIQYSSDLSVQDIVFELNGVDPDRIAELSGSVKGYLGKLWLGCLDEYENVIALPYQLVESELDVQDFEAAADGSCSIKITGHNGFWQFEREQNEVWSTENQKQLYPDDTGLDLLSTLENQDIAWTVT